MKPEEEKSNLDDKEIQTGELSLPQMLKHARRQSLGSRSSPEPVEDGDEEGESERTEERRQTRRHSLRAFESTTSMNTAAAGNNSLSIFDEIGDERGSLESLVFPMSYWRISAKEPSRDASMSPFSRIRTDIEQFVDASEKELEARLLMMGSGSANPCGSPLVGPSVTSAYATERVEPHSMLGTARTLWVGNLSDGMAEHDLSRLFASRVGPVESVRLIQAKRCAFVTMREQADVERAISLLNGYVVAGGGEAGGEALKVGYAKQTPSISSMTTGVATIGFNANRSTGSVGGLPNPATLDTSLPGDAPAELDLQHIFAPTLSDPIRHPLTPPVASASTHRRSSVAAVLLSTAAASSSSSNPMASVPSAEAGSPGPPPHHTTRTDFAEALPALPPPYFGPDLTPARIRDYRRHIESPACKPAEFDLIAMELLPVLVSAATDPVGNVLVQKLIERGSDELKSLIIGELAPFLATIGVHKNGTWVVQKLINWCHLPLHQEMVAEALRPYMVALMQDQFGNYVVQCCLAFAPPHNALIAESLCTQCLAIATSRFGARAMRSCLESPHTSAKALKAVAMALVAHGQALLCDANGSIVVQWLLDSDLPGRFALLLPALKASLPFLVTQRFAGNLLGKALTQTAEPEARGELLDAFIAGPEDPQSPLQAFLREPGNVPVALRLLSGSANSVQRLAFLAALRKALRCLPVTAHPHLQRLWDELSAPSTGGSSASIHVSPASKRSSPSESSPSGPANPTTASNGPARQPNERGPSVFP